MSKSLTLGSFFDGIGGWLLAARHAGVKPVWASEIDDFPATVTAHHFPQVKQLGDITKINVDELEPTDIICAGSPCQDLSVAGKREGLAGERSGLFVDAIKLVHGLRARTGKPRYFVWENVPGAFSSNKGHDFRAVLEEITKTEIPMPKDGRWAESGCVEWGGTSSLAWRTLDAQYWGVPQRRKRIFLVADFDGRSAGEILFIEQGLHGDSAESEGEGQEIATNVGESIDSASGLNGVYCVGNGQADQTKLSDKVGALNCMHDQQCVAVFREGSYADYKQDNACGTLKAKGGALSGGSESLLYQKNVGALCMDDYKGANNQYVDQDKCIVNNKTVRRLLPLECERLQGLPDSYTDIEFNGKPAPDNRRYKALGNGMAQPCADYVIRRIMDTCIGNA